ncbi:ABC transporter permease [Clostridium sp. YIM B02506]|uniref:ABC transporter permease n=1 Tax=Clostridium sp. YIM B02506 TaxID=2910680 RepID=UPI001EEDF222|nr:ABC transporter permease [Clostridium sp. YIM B02506]
MTGKVLKATFKRNFIVMIRAYPKDFFIGNVLTGFYTVIGALLICKMLFNGVVGDEFLEFTGTGDYMSYVILGSLTYLYVVRTCLNVSRSLITELREGTLESLMITPFKRGEYFIGNMLQQTVTTTFEVIVSLIIAIPFGLDLSNINLLSFGISALLALYGFFGLSMVLASIMLYTRDTYISQNTLFVAMLLLCGITFPNEYLPRVLRWIGELIPVTETSNLIRGSALLGKGVSELSSTMIYVFLLGTVYILVGFLSLRKIEYIALEKIQG